MIALVLQIMINVSLFVLQQSQDSSRFKIDPARGIIQVASPLYLDTGNYNLTVVATDNGAPPLSAEALVYVDMRRNENAPVFATNYTRNISEYASIGQHVVTVSASDSDPVTSPSGQLTYELVDGPTQGATGYFSLSEERSGGVISVNRSLRDFPSSNMYFRVRASDRGVPSKSDTAYVNVRYEYCSSMIIPRLGLFVITIYILLNCDGGFRA